MYVDLSALGTLQDPERAAFYAGKQKELNAKDTVDYEEVLKYKLGYCQEYFAGEGKAVLDTPEFKEFLAQNESWLMPYSYLLLLAGKLWDIGFLSMAR